MPGGSAKLANPRSWRGRLRKAPGTIQGACSRSTSDRTPPIVSFVRAPVRIVRSDLSGINLKTRLLAKSVSTQPRYLLPRAMEGCHDVRTEMDRKRG